MRVYAMTTKFDKPVEHLRDQLAGIRPGSLSPGFIETFRVSGRAIREVASVTVVKDRIHVMPFDRSQAASIARELEASKVNAYCLNPTTVCVPIPPITGEQKQEMAQHIKKLGEDAKVAIRSIRQSARKNADDKADKAIQKETDAAVKEVDRVVRDKIGSM